VGHGAKRVAKNMLWEKKTIGARNAQKRPAKGTDVSGPEPEGS